MMTPTASSSFKQRPRFGHYGNAHYYVIPLMLNYYVIQATAFKAGIEVLIAAFK